MSIKPPILELHPVKSKSPSAPYYVIIKWELFDKWNLVRFATPMDGSCLFHAISNSYFEPYYTEQLNGNNILRNDMVASLRKDLSNKLASKVDGKTIYETLCNGNISIFAESIPEFKMEYMQKELNSKEWIGYGYMEFIGKALNKDIYILDANTRDIYIFDELKYSITGDRNSIILYYITGHYELVGILNIDNTFTTYFAPTHSLIQFLYIRVKTLIK